ncbi:hypothetical protein [Fulvivirga lutea]|uniref:Uncharacterized protein n=1 Tax=Fulvivirga lutea TaxID=2810512 RepID=A0A975A276_9BACT|nr:hypothetical protein [Fulvivirga lutea]QSE98561.1 hypothetical protein JR347_05630 [Fulvivirga lutea]
MLVSLWGLYSCCANDDCGGNELYLSLRFEDANGNNLIADSTLSPDSINVLNIYETSQSQSPIGYVDEESNVLINLLFSTDSIKIIIEDKVVGNFNVDLTNYRDKGCCDEYENFNVYYDNEFCGDCRGTPIVITL